MFLQDTHGDDFKGAAMGGGEVYFGGAAFVMGLQEARRTKAPLVTGIETGKAKIGSWRREVVADIFGIGEEFCGHHRADRVAAPIRIASVAMAVAEETGHGII